jgi:hypothetical protein
MDAGELRDYLPILKSADCEIIVIDGSPADVFAQHHRVWSEFCRHEQVNPRFKCLNDKVNGIHTGVHLATTDKIVLADDDIRYTSGDIDEICSLLEVFKVVRPQNYFSQRWIGPPACESFRSFAGATMSAASPPNNIERGALDPPPLPWWAKMEGARMLINRAILRTADYPGTCAFRRSTMLRSGEYDGDVLFDNEEIIRHFARHVARIHYANDFFIRKRPPKFRKWLEQRPRQAYEDFGLRAKTTLFAVSLPGMALLGIFAGLWWMSIFALLIATTSILLAMAGRARGRAKDFFPFNVCFFAPLWVFERALSTYWAFYWFVKRGGYPFGDRLLSKGIGRDWIEGGKIAAVSASQTKVQIPTRIIFPDFKDRTRSSSKTAKKVINRTLPMMQEAATPKRSPKSSIHGDVAVPHKPQKSRE